MRKWIYLPLEHLLVGDARGGWIEVGLLGRRRLLEQSVGLKVLWDQRSTFAGVFGNDVATDGTALVEFEATVILRPAISATIKVGGARATRTHNVGNLAEGLLGQKFRAFVLALRKVNGDELEGDLLLLQHDGHPLGAGRMGRSVEFENHDEMCLKDETGERGEDLQTHISQAFYTFILMPTDLQQTMTVR